MVLAHVHYCLRSITSLLPSCSGKISVGIQFPMQVNKQEVESYFWQIGWPPIPEQCTENVIIEQVMRE